MISIFKSPKSPLISPRLLKCLILVVASVAFDISSLKKISGNFRKEFIFIGCQILNKELFKNYQINSFSISEIWENLLQTKGLNGYESENKFYHLTNLEIFKRLRDL